VTERGPRAVRDAFAAADADGRTALVCYILAGFPSETDALAAAEAALAAGADLLEIGVPFSDPLADGPTIADAGRTALDAGGGLPSAIGLAAALREAGHEQPIMLMTYLNPLLAAGERATLRAVADAGADGLIVPDLPAGGMPQLERLAAELGVAMTFLVAPNTADDRVMAAVAASTGFLYVVPLLGVTGARDSMAEGALDLLARTRRLAAGRLPVAAGFGISSPDQLARLAPVADGVVIGSALVAAMRDGGADALGRLVRRLAVATERTARRASRARA
jgi:tryptophan synthase alpha chain